MAEYVSILPSLFHQRLGHFDYLDLVAFSCAAKGFWMPALVETIHWFLDEFDVSDEDRETWYTTPKDAFLTALETGASSWSPMRYKLGPLAIVVAGVWSLDRVFLTRESQAFALSRIQALLEVRGFNHQLYANSIRQHLSHVRDARTVKAMVDLLGRYTRIISSDLDVVAAMHGCPEQDGMADAEL